MYASGSYNIRHFDMITDQILHHKKRVLFSFSMHSPVYTKYDSNPKSANITRGRAFYIPYSGGWRQAQTKMFWNACSRNEDVYKNLSVLSIDLHDK